MLSSKSDSQHSFVALATILVPVICLTSIGILTLLSTNAGNANPYFFFNKQIMWLVIALIVSLITSFINLEFLKKLAIPAAIISVILLSLVFTDFLGKPEKGSYRWLTLGGFVLQPSELTKLPFILCLSVYLHNNQRKITSFAHGLIKPMMIVGMFSALIILEPDYGTTAVYASIGFTLIFLAGARIWHIAMLVTPAIMGFAIMIYNNPIRLKRVLSFLDIEGTKTEGSYQLYQAILAFGSGKFSGVGIGEGRQQLSFLPEAHTDFVFAIIGEELGMIATMSIVSIFLFLFLTAIYSIRKAPNMFEFLLAIGSILMIIVQALFNMCVVTGLTPTKGISLPFISYGGSNLVVMFAFVGILVNCIRSWNKPFKIKSSNYE